ncbi:MAG: hypothetical protein LBR24_00675 [Methanobrevibacter sp.]|jgi:pantoate kinase|nr:hypothetical protein [Methanobrevibacter sp.]
MKVSVFVPSHISCFFSIHYDNDPLKTGSCGAGILLDKGITTSIKTVSADKIAIKINNEENNINKFIVEKTIDYFYDKFNLKEQFNEGLLINQEIAVPIGSGFGTSAASSL